MWVPPRSRYFGSLISKNCLLRVWHFWAYIMKIALVSLHQEWENKENNIRRCRGLAEGAAAFGAEIVIFPEMTLTGYTFNLDVAAEDSDNSPTLQHFSTLAKDNRIAIVIGAVLNDGVTVKNTLVAFDRQGKEEVRYAKMHPFSFAGEDRIFGAGDLLAKMKVGDFVFGFSICYDLRFPELYSALSKDCNVLVNIANWPSRRIHHWTTLLQARAIENQSFVIGVNRVGNDGNGLSYDESSMLFDANGSRVARIHHEGELAIVEIDYKYLEEFRRDFPTRKDRRPDLYKGLI